MKEKIEIQYLKEQIEQQSKKLYENIANDIKEINEVKNNNNILKHRKCDSYSGLRFPKKIQEKNSLLNFNTNKVHNNFLHSYSIILNNNNTKSKKIIKNINSNYSDFNLLNSVTNIHTTKNKSNKNFQLSMRLSHDFITIDKKIISKAYSESNQNLIIIDYMAILLCSPVRTIFRI